MKKHLPLIIFAFVALIPWALFLFCLKQTSRVVIGPYQAQNIPGKPDPATSTPVRRPPIEIVLPAIKPTITLGVARVSAQSAKIFAYAHGTAVAKGKIFIGMADVAGNTFDSNQLIVFDNAADISRNSLVHLPLEGDLQDLIYDDVNDRIYLLLSSSSALNIFSLNPYNKALSVIISTTSVNVGRKPAMVTDGAYIYGITNTEPSTVFKVKIADGELMTSSLGHISKGHSAALGRFGSTTELYFGGGMSDEFEKVDALTLSSLGKVKVNPCSMTDDMPFMKQSSSYGYVYIGCEMVPYGLRVRTDNLSFERFSLLGSSLGFFVFNSDLYNAARDGFLDIFPKADIRKMERYWVVNDIEPFETKGQSLELNEILSVPDTKELFFTAWYGIRGLYKFSTSTLESLVKAGI